MAGMKFSVAAVKSAAKTPPQDSPLTKQQAQAGAKATGGTANQDFKNNGEWVYGPKGGAPGSANVNQNVRNWMTKGNASKGPRI